MAASDEAMYITPTSETIEHLDVLRKDGESFSDIVARLAADQIKERLANEDAVFHAHLVPDLREAVEKVRYEGETHSSAIIRIVEAFQNMEGVRVGKLTPDLWQKLDAIRFEEEAYVNVIHRLIEEHMGSKQQQAMTPLGSTKVMRVKPETCYRVESMGRVGEDYDAIITRLLDERYLYRKIAKNMSSEGRRLILNQDAIINNFKRIIRELVAIDAVNVHETDSVVRQDVDELMEDMLNTDGGSQ
jgi:predicted CopG family antitoxin